MAAWWRSYISQQARRYGLDPRAVLAVASQEGLGGGVGDSGHAFGPFQMNDAGGVLTGRGGNHRAFAESRQGIDYALRGISGVARGQHGAQAVRSIVSRYERPKDPGGEIARALAAYGGTAVASSAAPLGVGTAPAPRTPTAPSAPDTGDLRHQLAQTLITASQRESGDLTESLGLIRQLRSAQMQPQPQQSVGSAPIQSALAAGKSGSRGGPSRGGPSLSFLTPLAKRFGLQVTSTTEGKHVPGSYHYQSRAEDYGGDPRQMAALMRYALAHPRQFVEAFYDPAGYYVKNGRVHKGSIGGHGDHVHLAR